MQDTKPLYFALLKQVSAIFWLALSSIAVCQAEDYQELLLFPSIQGEYFQPLDSSTGQESSEKDLYIEAAVDLFFALSYKDTRFLTEALAATDELELERAQLGWEYKPGHRIWFGRFHTPLGFWNSNFNHSPFLQTSIHRPSIVNYEDKGGILPLHVAGAMTEGDYTLGTGLLEYSFVYGAGAKIEKNELTSTRIIDIRKNGIETNLFGHIAYHPDELSETQLGLFGGYSNLSIAATEQSSIDQFIVGGFFHRSWLNTRIYGSAFYVNNTIKDVDTNSDDFIAGYVHGEYELTSQLVNYVRYEDSIGTKNDAYISLLSPLPRRQAIVGIRLDINNAHAISFDIVLSQLHTHNQVHTSMQWSAVFP